MLLWIFTHDDETGLLDNEHKDGDIMQTKPDGSPVGTQEPKSYLIVQVPDPASYEMVAEELVRSQYEPGATPSSEHEMRHKRIYRLDWRSKFTAAEIALIESATEMLPDGDTAQGGTVASGVVSGLFTLKDFRRNVLRR